MAVTWAFSWDSGGWRQDGALTGLQGCGELKAQGLRLGVEGRADSRGLQVLHQLGLGAPGRVVLDAVVAAQKHREAVLQEALRGAHEEPARPRLHVVLPEILQEEEEARASGMSTSKWPGTWDPQLPLGVLADAEGDRLGLSALPPTSWAALGGSLPSDILIYGLGRTPVPKRLGPEDFPVALP